ncbi:MAG: hypothetical protein ACREKS_24845 [Candidatus Rokuibacteriota bacterium]
MAERCPDPEVRKSIETNRARLDQSDRLLTDLELPLTRSAKVQDGIGKILALVLLYEMHLHAAPTARGQLGLSWSRSPLR